ncbi:ArsR/SmtB family transcription factor [Xanthomonas bonasiae]|uniref:ArsR/SmtB family transcription factor n=1 Tax=Xanthomonas bonasiae TaxID=2810351 RepID=UPI0017857D35|nr:helix-turn-helix transcriptional regulator [Xanthomonas surreyensis]MBD7921071.1 helix-turn-helix transcriptional regulator [Xanthomonas surreyensis]
MDTDSTVSALRALAHGHRLAAYRALVQAGPDGMAVGELRAALGLAAATLTAHLHVLRGAGLIADERQGRVIRLRADYARMYALIGFLTENCCGNGSCSPDAAAPAAARVP